MRGLSPGLLYLNHPTTYGRDRMSAKTAQRTGPTAAENTPAVSRPHALAGPTALATFVMLVAALCGRALLWEMPEREILDLVMPPDAIWSAGPMITYAMHVLTGLGLVLCAVQQILARRPWRLTGLEAGAGLLIVAGLLAVPAASDKRLAIVTALDTILPLLAAAGLYQVMVQYPIWRRAALAVLVAMAAAQCGKATARASWEYAQTLAGYEQHKDDLWRQLGVGPNDPIVTYYEGRLKDETPRGYFQHANALGAMMLLGLAGTIAAVGGSQVWRRRAADSVKTKDAPLPRESVREHAGGHAPDAAHAALQTTQDRDARQTVVPGMGMAAGIRMAGSRLRRWMMFAPAGVVLFGLVAWQMVLLIRVQSSGAFLGLAGGIAAYCGSVLLRSRPRVLAITVLAAVAIPQATLTVASLDPSRLYTKLMESGGEAESLAIRLYLWDGAARMFVDHPITGVGPGQFRRHYNAINPAYIPIEPTHPHNWLLAVAAEWGIFGVAGLVTALVAVVWRIVRSLAARGDHKDAPVTNVLALAGLALLACWLPAAWDHSPGLGPVGMPVAVGAIAAAAVVWLAPRGRLSHAVLLAGVVAFMMHGLIGIPPGIAGTLWAFWALAAIAMAWSAAPDGEVASSSTAPAHIPAGPSVRRYMHIAVAASVGLAGLVTIGLSIQPLRAASLVHEARLARADGQRQEHIRLLERAAAVDTLDPTPLAAAGFATTRLTATGPEQKLRQMQEAVRLYEAAVARDPLRHILWQALAGVRMPLACAVGDVDGVRRAIAEKQRELNLYPTNAAGLYQLALMAAVKDPHRPDDPTRLRLAIESVDKALTVDRARPERDLRRLKPHEVENLRKMREELVERLEAVGGHSGGPALSS